MINAILSAGVFVAVPITGMVALGRLDLPVPRIARLSLWISVGLAIWSVPLLLSLMMSIYSPPLLGAAGWFAVVVLVALRKVGRPRLPRLGTWDRVALVGTFAAAVLTGAFAHDPFIAHGDIGDYANHAVYMANHGRLDIPYPWDLGVPADPEMFGPLGHLNPTQPTLTARFGHLFPAWLAQAWAVAGYEGLVRLNVVFGFFSLLTIYGLLRRLARASVAAVATVFLAFNPAQVWVVRQTLTETLTQLLIWAGLLLLTAYLARGRPAWGFWAGALLGTGAMVRLDVFLVVPFLIAGHAVWRALQSRRADPWVRSWTYVYLGAVPAFVAAFAYYVFFSNPYLVDHAAQVLGIGALTVAAGSLLALTFVPGAGRWVGMFLSRRLVLAGMLGGLALLAAYAYFIRPIIPPFDTYPDPFGPPLPVRSRIEEALPNLGRYLMPGVVWASLAGWSLAWIGAVRNPRWRAILPLLAICLGCTAVYAWDQNALPDHFTAVRRFTPVIIPAIVVFAGMAATAALRRLSFRGRGLALSASVVVLVVFTFVIGVHTYTIQQRQGSYATLTEWAASVPAGKEVLGLGNFFDSGRWWMPLYLSFDRPITPVDITTQEGLDATVARLRAASPENPLLIMSGKATPLAPVEGRIIDELKLSHLVIANYVVPVPSQALVQDYTLTTFEATGMNIIGAELVARTQWMVILDGMYAEQVLDDGTTVRWTSGHGRVVVPIEGDTTPTRLSISIADSGPTGGNVQILLNGIQLFDGATGPGTWSRELEVPVEAGLRSGTTAEVEIISNTFQPDPALGYTGVLGVGLGGLTFLGPVN